MTTVDEKIERTEPQGEWSFEWQDGTTRVTTKVYARSRSDRPRKWNAETSPRPLHPLPNTIWFSTDRPGNSTDAGSSRFTREAAEMLRAAIGKALAWDGN